MSVPAHSIEPPRAPTGPWLLTVPQAAGLHDADAAVRAREDTLLLAVVNVAGLSAAWPWIVSAMVPLCVSSAVN